MPIEMFSPKNTRSNDFRTVFANTIGFQFNGNDLILRFSVLRNMANESDGIEEQVAVAMSPATAKALMFSLQQVLTNYETANNTTIPLNPALVELVEKAIAQSAKSKAK